MGCECAAAPTFPNATNELSNPSFELAWLTAGSWVSQTVTPTATNVQSATVRWAATSPADASLTAETSIDNQATFQTVTNGGAISGISVGDDISSTNINVRFTFASSDQTHTIQVGLLEIAITDDGDDSVTYGLATTGLELTDGTGNGRHAAPSFPLLTTGLTGSMGAFQSTTEPTAAQGSSSQFNVVVPTVATTTPAFSGSLTINPSAIGYGLLNPIATNSNLPIAFFYILIAWFFTTIAFVGSIPITRNLVFSGGLSMFVLAFFIVGIGAIVLWVLIFHAIGIFLAVSFNKGITVGT